MGSIGRANWVWGKVLEPVVHVRVNSRVRYGLRDHLAQLATTDSFHQYRVVARRRGSLSDEPHGRTSRKGHQAAAVDVADLPGSTAQGSLRPRRIGQRKRDVTQRLPGAANDACRQRICQRDVNDTGTRREIGPRAQRRVATASRGTEADRRGVRCHTHSQHSGAGEDRKGF